MNSFGQIAWFPLCGGLTVLGLLLTWAVGRRRGPAAVLRGVAWSLLPLAAYLTGVIELAWRIVAAGVGWVTRLVFSPVVWAGLALTALCVVLFVVSGALRRRRQGTGPARGRPTEPRRRPEEVTPPRRAGEGDAAGSDGSDDFADVEEILRRRGIT